MQPHFGAAACIFYSSLIFREQTGFQVNLRLSARISESDI